MFYNGTLQSGIAQAIQQQKLVACFIRDDSATSRLWEEDWLRSGGLPALVAQKAILLRIESGSTDAGFLGAFCSIEGAPMLVVVRNGRLECRLGSAVGREEFVDGVRGALGGTMEGREGGSAQEGGIQTQVLSPPRETGPPPPGQTAPPPPTTAAPSKVKGKQRADASPQAGIAASPATTTSAQQAARAALQKKKRQDAEELARIKARIEQDKASRKAQAEARKAEREAERAASQPAQDRQPPSQPRATSSSTRGSQAPTVHLNVRLFDGRTIRSTFPRTATLDSHVRPWIDAEFAALPPTDPNLHHAALPPYLFRHILAPQPSRELSAGDETQALADVDLAPSATLVLVPVRGYADAYAGAGMGTGTNLMAGTRSGIVKGAFGLLASTVEYAGSVLGGLLGSAGQPQGQTVGGGATTTTTTTAGGINEREDAGVRVRTLADRRAREAGNQQFYNGNQSNVEPRPDDRG